MFLSVVIKSIMQTWGMFYETMMIIIIETLIGNRIRVTCLNCSYTKVTKGFFQDPTPVLTSLCSDCLRK